LVDLEIAFASGVLCSGRLPLHRWRGVKLGKGIWIKHVEFRAALPKTPSGKIKKTDLL
jgi:acyl-coenzyme A synthetase/AMP-(fatty) acid ligase